MLRDREDDKNAAVRKNKNTTTDNKNKTKNKSMFLQLVMEFVDAAAKMKDSNFYCHNSLNLGNHRSVLKVFQSKFRKMLLGAVALCSLRVEYG